MRGDFISISKYLLDLIYPPMCGICGKLDSNSLCRKCEIQLNKHAIFSIEEKEKNSFFFSELYSIFFYQGMIRNLILQYKFQEKSYIYLTFANFLLKSEKIFAKIQSYDIIIPVPISKKRNKKRGYNQSALIAREISTRVDGEYLSNILIKKKDIIEQSKLDKQNRLENIKGAYEVQEGEILNGKQILLVDDIYTTGSTVKECCRMIQNYNPKRIGVLVLAKD